MIYEKTSPPAQGGGSTIPPGTMIRSEPLLLLPDDISAILDLLNSRYGAGTQKAALSVGFDSSSNSFFWTFTA